MTRGRDKLKAASGASSYAPEAETFSRNPDGAFQTVLVPP